MNPSANFSLTPQVNDVMEGKNTPLESGDPKEVSNEEDDVYAEQREHIMMIMSSYDDTDSDDSQINSEIQKVKMKLLRIWNRLQLIWKMMLNGTRLLKTAAHSLLLGESQRRAHTPSELKNYRMCSIV